MKQPCKIQVKNTRFFHIADCLSFPPHPKEDDWEDWEEGEIFSDEDELLKPLFGDIATDRTENEPMSAIAPPPVIPTTLYAQGLFSQEADGSFHISYEDSEITGLEGCLTTFCLTADKNSMVLLRSGNLRTCMSFEEGARRLCDYGLEGGVPSVTLHTHRLKAGFTEEGGKITVDYSVEIRGSVSEHNELEITFSL